MSATVHNIHKPTLQIDTQVNIEVVNAHRPLPFVLGTLVNGLFSLVCLGGRLRRLHRGDGILIGAMPLTESRDK